MTKTFRVAHISDIHFRWGFPRYQWKHVKEVLRIHKPAALIATGDFVESPWPLMLILARREMLDFAAALKAPLIAIPGNHDVAFKGFAPIWPLTRLYAIIFSSSSDKWLSGFPTFTEFNSKGFFARFFWRILLYLRILLRLRTLLLEGAGDREAVQVPKLEGVPLKIMGFDSNRSLLLGSGRVSPGQINDFGSHAFQLENDEDISASLLPRVALIHHHLVPIPYTRTDIAGNESLLVMRNAGTMLKELWNHDFDLVLHGHRHYFSFTRVSFDRGAEGGRSLAVLSAASPTTKELEARSNSFHLLDFCPNGVIRACKIAFGNEMTVHDSSEEQDQWFTAVALDSVKARNYRRMVKVMNHSCDRIEQELHIDPTGAATEISRYHGLRVRAGGELTRRPFGSRVDRGSVDNILFEELADLWPSGCYLSKPEKSEDDPQEVNVGVVFNPPLTEGRSVSFGIRSQIPNSFAMSDWEISTFPGKRRGSHSGLVTTGMKEETLGLRLKFPVRTLRLVLKLPDTLRNPEPYAVCYATAGYPVLALDKLNGDVSKPATEPWLADGDVSKHESAFLKQSAEPNTWEWKIEYPLVGYKYEIRWHVEDIREEKVDRRMAGQTIAYRESLLKYARNAFGTTRGRMAGAVRVREILMGDYLKPIYEGVANAIGEKEIFRVCVFVFDPERKCMVAVEEAVIGDAQPVTEANQEPLSVPFGEGVAGLTFKRCAGTAYFASPVDDRKGPEVGLFRQAEARQLKAIVGIPLFHPDALAFARGKVAAGKAVEWADLPSVYQAVGVLTFASNSAASGLTAFQEGADAAELFQAMQDVVAEKSLKLLNAVSSAVRDCEDNP